jgi:uncharacterized tellurite resistance protein B-like protein
MTLDREASWLYARALVAIARADHEISLDEGLTLTDRIAARCTIAIPLEDVLGDKPLDIDELAALATDGPFRTTVDPFELARMLVEDGIAVVLSKGHVTSSEARMLRGIAAALGVSAADFQRIAGSAARWIP